MTYLVSTIDKAYQRHSVYFKQPSAVSRFISERAICKSIYMSWMTNGQVNEAIQQFDEATAHFDRQLIIFGKRYALMSETCLVLQAIFISPALPEKIKAD